GLALLRLAGRRRVRIRVGVQVVVAGARDAAVGGRRRRAALVVGALRGGDDDEALTGAVLVALAQQRRDVAEPQRGVVADGLRRRQEGDRRVEQDGRVREVLHAQRDERILGEALQRHEGLPELLVDRRRARQRLRP